MNLCLLRAVVFSSFVCAAAVAQTICAEADAAFPKIMQALGKGNAGAAETLLRQLPAAQRGCPAANLALGRMEAARNRVQPALRAFAAYVQARPDDPAGRADLAQAQLLAGLPGEARKNAAAAAQSAVEPALLLAAGEILQRAGAPGEAEAALRKAVRQGAGRQGSEQARALFRLGSLYDSRQQHAQAEQAFRQALALNPDNAQAWDYLGLSLEPQGRAEEAEQAYRKGLAVNRAPYFDAFLPYNYGRLLAKLNRLEEALEHLHEAAELAPKTRAVRYERAKVRFRMDRFEEAREDAERALALSAPRNVVAESQIYYLLVRICRRLGDDAAVRRYAQLAKDAPPPRNLSGR